MLKENSKKCDVLGIGSPLLDIIMSVDEVFLNKMNLKKGIMNFISKEDSLDISEETQKIAKKILLGGSSANTISGVNALGTSAGFMGVLGKDNHGDTYREQTEKEGVISHLQYHDKHATGHAFTFITPDGERTFATHLGAAVAIEKKHIKEAEIRDAKFFHIEAYQLEDPLLCRALFHAIAVAKEAGTKISLDLSDAELIKRNKALFQDVIREHIDIVFANEEEAKEFTGKSEKNALCSIADMCDVAVVKLGSRGSLIKSGDQIYQIESCKVIVENTNGAGDMYASGILHGLVCDLGLKRAGEIASFASSLVVASPGARLHKKHLDSVRKFGNMQ
jgi:sugar/nucleoside kinase (ribokinase family)